jgi:predicted anti-sigma-YlaC factor YlaD
MVDCANVTMRELLPDLLHGSLGGIDAAAVEAHVASCARCRAELEVLRSARAHLLAVPVPAIDRSAIARALPRPRVRTAAPMRWRWAAVITMVALGGASVATAVRSFTGEPSGSDTLSVAPVVVRVDTPVAAAASAPGGPAMARMTAGGDVGDLADEDLELLIGALENIEVAPLAEPAASRHSRWVSGSTGGN